MVCAACGEWADPPRVHRQSIVCEQCGHQEAVRRLPALFVTGASGTGKSTVCRRLAPLVADRLVVLEQDVLWVGALQDPTDDYAAFRRTWLRMVAMLNQSGRPSLLCGTVVPPQLESRPERTLLGTTHYLALVADEDVIRERLAARPAWRGWRDGRRVDDMAGFNRWIMANAATTDPPMTVLDTTHRSVDDTVADVADWALARCAERR